MASNQGTPDIINRSYNSFSGVDIKAVFGSKIIAELQAISYSITREKAPIYTMGSADCRSYSRGKRGIAGTLIFVMFDRHALLSAMSNTVFAADNDEVRSGYAASNNGASQSLNVAAPATPGIPSVVGPGAGVPAGAVGTTPAADVTLANPWYVDQIPPFDVTLAAVNEYGSAATMRIYGCEILNEGYGVSIDDIVSEEQFTYVARSILPWTAVAPVPGSLASGTQST